MNVRDAVAKSDNAAAVRVLRDAGAASVVEWARALGIESKLGATDSLALGAYEVTPLELVSTFAVFASGGVVAPPVLVTRVAGPGRALLDLPARPPERRVLGQDEAYLVTSLMKSVVQYGTGRRAQSLGRPVAGKTGTTNEAKDAWFVGYSTEIVAGVWVGYDDARPLGPGESGAVTALPAWVSFMKAAHEKRPATEFVRPGNIVVARIDPETGLLARNADSAIEEEFLDGTAPTEMTPAADAGAPAPKAATGTTARPDGGAATDETPPF